MRFLLSGGQCFDGNAAVPLLKPLPPPKKLLADKAYDCAAFRDWLSRRGTTPIAANLILITSEPIGTATRSSASSAVSRMPDALLPDKCANNFLSAVCLVALNLLLF